MNEYTPVKLAYDVFQPATGKDSTLSPIIFLHGLSGSKETWIGIPQKIADGTKRIAYAYDARNHGDSEFHELFTFDLNVEDLFHFMDVIRAPKAVLIGYSMGGITAIRAALLKPERVEMVFIEDMFTKKLTREIIEFVTNTMNLWLASVSTIPKELSESEAVKHAIDFMYSQIPPGTLFVAEKEKIYNSGIQLKRSSDGTYNVKFNKDIILPVLMIADKIMSETCGQFDGQAFFIYGAHSPFCVGQEEDDIKRHFPRAELIEIAEATHNIHYEFPDKIVEVILQRFLAM